MSFRRKNVVVSQAGGSVNSTSNDLRLSPKQVIPPGLRPSPLDGRLTTSTGTSSVDGLLAGHSGLVLGTSLLVEETGTTDFGGCLLRYFASQGVVHGHHVHVLGVAEGWGRDLPGLATDSGKGKEQSSSEEKMKIAWRYEKLGEFGVRDRNPSNVASQSASKESVFCHNFDLSKRLTLPSPSNIFFIPTARPNLSFDAGTSESPFPKFLKHLTAQLSSNTGVHRVVIPNLLSPAIYSSESCRPENILQFMHAFRALLRKYPTQLTAIITLPLTLYPRSTGLTRWIELLSDGVLELAPFPSTAITTKSTPASTVHEEHPQGMLKIHRLPIFHEKGGGGEASGFDDLAFTLSRRKGLVVKPFSLPPVEGDVEAQGGLEHDHGKATKVDIEF